MRQSSATFLVHSCLSPQCLRLLLHFDFLIILNSDLLHHPQFLNIYCHHLSDQQSAPLCLPPSISGFHIARSSQSLLFPGGEAASKALLSSLALSATATACFFLLRQVGKWGQTWGHAWVETFFSIFVLNFSFLNWLVYFLKLGEPGEGCKSWRLDLKKRVDIAMKLF